MAGYYEEDLRRMFEEARESSFIDISRKTMLIFGGIKWPEDAVRGLLAHELAHQASYERRS